MERIANSVNTSVALIWTSALSGTVCLFCSDKNAALSFAHAKRATSFRALLCIWFSSLLFKEVTRARFECGGRRACPWMHLLHFGYGWHAVVADQVQAPLNCRQEAKFHRCLISLSAKPLLSAHGMFRFHACTCGALVGESPKGESQEPESSEKTHRIVLLDGATFSAAY